MSTRPAPIPEGYTTVTPWIVSEHAASVMDFIAKAFGATELGRMADPDGKIAHPEMRIGTGVVMLFDAPEGWSAVPAFIRLYLDDAQATFDRAVASGATPITQVTPLAFGDAVGRVRDPFGNIWWLQQRLETVSAEEQARRWTDPRWSQAMDYVTTSFRRAGQNRSDLL